MRERKRLTTNLITMNFRLCLPHILFFLMRIVVFAVIKLTTNDLIPIFNEVRDSVNDTVYLAQFNLCQLYLSLDSLLNASVMKYRLISLLSFHNAVLSTFIACFTLSDEYTYQVFLSLITALFAAECLYTLYVSYNKGREFEHELSKKIGRDERINEAYVVRKCLEIASEINFFLVCAMAGRFVYNPLTIITSTSYVILCYAAVSFLQQLFLRVKFNGECVVQRRVAIVLSVVKTIMAGATLAHYAWAEWDTPTTDMMVETLLLSDLIILAAVELYYVVLDASHFGSGLKYLLALKTTRLTLGVQ